MIKFLTISFLSLLLISCKRENDDNHTEIELPPREVLVDTTDGEQYIAILQTDNLKKTTNLSKKELTVIEKLLREKLNTYNEKVEKDKIDLRFYKRQYFPQVDENGNKLVRIFCFCSVEDNDDWKTQKKISPNDGGKCFFHALINISQKKVIEFNTHGRA